MKWLLIGFVVPFLTGSFCVNYPEHHMNGLREESLDQFASLIFKK
jgi:hypothetical protein